MKTSLTYLFVFDKVNQGILCNCVLRADGFWDDTVVTGKYSDTDEPNYLYETWELAQIVGRGN